MNLIVGLKFRPFLMYQPATVNQDPIMISLWFFTLLKECIKTIKNSKYHLLKINRFLYIDILSVSGNVWD